MRNTGKFTGAGLSVALFALIAAAGCVSSGGAVEDLVKKTEAAKGNDYFTVQISKTPDGSDVDKSKPWVGKKDAKAFKAALKSARKRNSAAGLQEALETYKAAIKADGSNPYYRGDPGKGIPYITYSEASLAGGAGAPWTEETGANPENYAPFNDGKLHKWRANDGRLLWARSDPPYLEQSSFEVIQNPFASGTLVKVRVYHNPAVSGRSFGGFGVRIPLTKTVEVDGDSFVEFDLYYPFSAAGLWMRMEFWSTDTGGAGDQSGNGSNGRGKSTSYIRTESLDAIGNLNPDWTANYEGETWSKKHIRTACAANGSWSHLNIDFHSETGAVLDGAALMAGDIKITKPDPDGIPIPLTDVVLEGSEKEGQAAVAPVRSKYNEQNGLFMVGAIGTGPVEKGSARGNHYEIFVDGNNLKAESVHKKHPAWLTSPDPDFTSWAGEAGETALDEYAFPTEAYKSIRDSHFEGEPSGGFKVHGHVLAWYNQAPVWMRQITPEHLGMDWNDKGAFYAYGNNAQGPFWPVKKEDARRMYFNHIMYELRHFMTADEKYGSSEERGVIPFHSFDVLNEEIHESRHSVLAAQNPNDWKGSLKSISWLAAMTDDDFDDTREHYIYLLFKYAHIAVPNAQMADKFKANYAELPQYMKLDGHDYSGDSGTPGDIGAYITENPPRLTYNDYGVSTWSKAKTAYNMIKELNALWKTDVLYDGRPLIEVMGVQGHDAVGPSLASDNQRLIALYASLIDEGLLSGVAYSELDLKIPETSPGGGAVAPALMNQKQADALGYQYALLYKTFAKYARYIDHVISWGVSGSGWQGGYVLFNSLQKANQGYYGVMDPDKFIAGHAYLDSYFAGEYAKTLADYKPEL
ncbi:MAG: endo-1,4-beta-xylanase [Spirochaetaceae bacterium]|jgi:GH35 family endo-1,4-beta-xylanase|nr:endo-1,4-beta-xylanase [Spirochaetaceae bacterium]